MRGIGTEGAQGIGIGVGIGTQGMWDAGMVIGMLDMRSADTGTDIGTDIGARPVRRLLRCNFLGCVAEELGRRITGPRGKFIFHVQDATGASVSAKTAADATIEVFASKPIRFVPRLGRPP